jgi:TRAP-type C4-dicarboxylate transport system substrate-binding protein
VATLAPRVTAIVVVLIVAAGVVGYFVGLTTATPPPGVTTPVTVTVPTTVRITVPTTVTVAPTPAPAEVYRLKLAAHLVAGEPRYRMFTLTFVELVKNLSKGRLIIEPYPAGELGPVGEIPAMVAKGVADLGEVFPGYYTAVDPLFELLGAIPGPISHASELMYLFKAFEPELRSICEEKLGVVYIGLFIGQVPEHILFLRSPIKSLYELKGKIIRSIGLSAAFYGKFGAKTVALPGGELYSALQLGTIDGAEWGGYLPTYGLKLHEVAPYIVESPVPLHAQAHGIVLVANPETWRRLPDDLKSIIRAAAEYVFLSTYTRLYYENFKYREKYIAEGAKFIPIPPEEIPLIFKYGSEVIVERFRGYPDLLVKYISILKDLGYRDWAERLEALLKG